MSLGPPKLRWRCVASFSAGDVTACSVLKTNVVFAVARLLVSNGSFYLMGCVGCALTRADGIESSWPVVAPRVGEMHLDTGSARGERSRSCSVQFRPIRWQARGEHQLRVACSGSFLEEIVFFRVTLAIRRRRASGSHPPWAR